MTLSLQDFSHGYQILTKSLTRWAKELKMLIESFGKMHRQLGETSVTNQNAKLFKTMDTKFHQRELQ